MMEEHKLLYLESLLESRNQNVERYISAIGELEQMARDCYAEPISLNGAQFVEMLVLDGCFIIELTRKFKGKGLTYENDPITQTQWMANNVVRDLILFENQIPFFVLCKLFDLIEGENKHHVLINYLLRFCWASGIFPPTLRMSYHRRSEGIKHLLELVYSSWVSPTDDIHLSVEGDKPHDYLDKELNFIPSATELKDANAEFHKEKSDTPFEVKFENGNMKMPYLQIHEGTECFERNLIAYEQYFLKNQHNIVADYVVLLDCLINSSKDVKILSECGIIDNWFGNNEMVANIINRLAESVVCRGRYFVYGGMFHDANGYYKKPWNRWMAMLRRNIFHSLWGYISFFAASTLLILTIVQAVCSVLQVV